MRLLTDLYPFQKAGVEKLAPLRVGALYMEMGTGKTRTALELVAKRMNAGKIDFVVWLCPCSVLGNLRSDVKKHAEDAQNIAYCGIESLSSSVRLYSLLMRIVTTRRCMLIVDESNMVKNPVAIRTKRITEIASKCPYRLILNGTPISRTEADLFAQWYILDWRILGYQSYWSFSANHLEIDKNGRIERALNTDYLHRKIAPYSYQVRKSEALSLPQKKNCEEGYAMSAQQTGHYNVVAEYFIEKIDDSRPETIYRMFSALQSVISGRYVYDKKSQIITETMYTDPFDNPRIQALLSVIEKSKDDKIIIFAKYTSEIVDILHVLREKYGSDSSVPFYGKITRKKREENISRFRADARFFVANKACAGYGLNLQFCNNVIFYSNDWDYATRIQAEDRVHRAGQNMEVTITDIYAARTLDVRIIESLTKKENLADAFKKNLSRESAKNLRKWLSGR